MASEAPQGVHFVGSSPFRTAEQHFRRVCHDVPNHIKSLADGETGPQENWIVCQIGNFAKAPRLLPSGIWGFPAHNDVDGLVPLEEVPAMLGDIEVNYDKWALDSYKVFKKLRDEGVIPRHVKFQVCLPTTISVMIVLVHTPYHATIEPIYEKALLKALHNIQDNIPHEDLVIQWDIVQEVSLLEGVPYGKENAYGLGKESQAWFEPVQEGIFERLVRLMSNVASDVSMGMHICYGDFMHKHFIEPPSTAKIALITKQLLTQLPVERKIDYIQFPVAKAREDEAYFEPLKDVLDLVKQKGTYLYAGLVHPNNEEGTERKIEAAKKVLGSSGWGVAAECGLGREPVEGASSVMDICKAVAKPWGSS